MVTFIETQFPIARLSAESYKERKSGAGQTLTNLGKWWGRKPLILCRAVIIGMLMPASKNQKKDREIFLKILTMDDDGAWQRCSGQIPVVEWRRFAPQEIQEEYFSARGFKAGLTDEEKSDICDQIWESLTLEQQAALDTTRRRQIQNREEFDSLPYAERIKCCLRPEQIVGPTPAAWSAINEHLGTTAASLRELVAELGQTLFGHTPRVGDAFCGGGSIPFEAVHIGCNSFGSDLNPVATFLTWASLNLLGLPSQELEELKRVQRAVYKSTKQQIDQWQIEHNDMGEVADAYLYCVETRPEGCEYFIPLAPSWVIAEKTRTIVRWHRVNGCDRLQPEVVQVSASELKDMKSKKGATVVDSRVIDPFDANRSWSVEGLRGTDGLRLWTNEEVVSRQDDVFQERLYCIRWVDNDGNRRYAAPNAEDLRREDRVLELLRERFREWQHHGYIPSRAIPEGGDKTEEPIRTRGWTHWHHLFTPRQLLAYGLYLSNIPKTASRIGKAHLLLKLAIQTNWNSKLNVWNANLGKGGGAGYSEQTFANQALNPLFNYGTRSFSCLQDSLLKEPVSVSLPQDLSASVKSLDARDIGETCDLWITDPPYADAINYHELADFFLCWYDRTLAEIFPDWIPDSRSELAVRGDGENFRRALVEIYKNLTKHMPDNGMQVVMFTHQDPAVWADLGMVLWSAGLKATAAWTISTETAAGLKKGNYVQGTVCLVLRKRTGSEPGFLDEIYPMVEDEVCRQIDSMQALDEESEPNFNDADYQLAGYAAALKVLTQYGNIDGRDVEHEVFAVRGRNEKSDFQTVIERALEIACDYLVPKGLDQWWRDLSLTERYYLRALDIESRGERRKGMYEELARGFGVTDIRSLLKSDKANGARMFTASGLSGTLLAAVHGSDTPLSTLPVRRGRANSGITHPFASSVLRHLMFAVRETRVADGNPELGRQYLRDTFGQIYWTLRERFIGLLDWLSNLGNAAGMEEWEADSNSARVLAGRLRNDHA